MEFPKIAFRGEELEIIPGTYAGNQRVALRLFDKWSSCYCTASVNLPNEKMADNEIAIKDYSENEGILLALVSAGVVSSPIRYVSSGYVSIPICLLLINPKED